jgi:hypothetical protein
MDIRNGVILGGRAAGPASAHRTGIDPGRVAHHRAADGRTRARRWPGARCGADRRGRSPRSPASTSAGRLCGPISRPMSALVRCRWRIRTTPSTMNSRPTMPNQTRCSSPGSNTRIRWKIPDKIMRTPSRTASTFSEPVGWKLTMTPRINVKTPRNSIACQDPAITPGDAGWAPCSSETIDAPYIVSPEQPGDRPNRARASAITDARRAGRRVVPWSSAGWVACRSVRSARARPAAQS